MQEDSREPQKKQTVGMFNKWQKLKTCSRLNLSGRRGEEAEEGSPPGSDTSLATGCSQSGGRTTAPGTNLLRSLVASLVSLLLLQKRKVLRHEVRRTNESGLLHRGTSAWSAAAFASLTFSRLQSKLPAQRIQLPAAAVGGRTVICLQPEAAYST